MPIRTSVAFILLIFGAGAEAQTGGTPPAAQARATAQVIAITGGTVFPVSGPKIEGGTVLIRDGRVHTPTSDDLAHDGASPQAITLPAGAAGIS